MQHPVNAPPYPDLAPSEPERLSQILSRLAAGDQPRMTVADLFGQMRARAHTTLLVVFALPNVLPSIPGTSAVTGLPLVYLALQLALGRAPWLPGFIANRSFSQAALAGLIARAMPWLERAERGLRPRLQTLTTPAMARLVGGLMVVLALAVLLPIPFGNLLPALAIILFSIGLMERDGAWILAGFVTMILGAVVFSTLLWGLFKAALLLALSIFATPS